MEYDKKFFAIALGIIITSNSGNIVDVTHTASDAATYVTKLEAERMKSEMIAMQNAHNLAELAVFEKIRQRISNCEYRLSPPSTLYKDYINKLYSMEAE